MMLKSDISYNNNPKILIKELNLDENIMFSPNKVIFYKSEEYKKDQKYKPNDKFDKVNRIPESEVDSEDNLKLLYHLVTPKIVTISYRKIKTLVVIKIVPSNICYTVGVEFYDLKIDSLEKVLFIL